MVGRHAPPPANPSPHLKEKFHLSQEAHMKEGTEGLLSEFWAWLERVDDSVFGVWRIRDTDTLERDSRTDA
jgi:hypothetical protein